MRVLQLPTELMISCCDSFVSSKQNRLVAVRLDFGTFLHHLEARSCQGFVILLGLSGITLFSKSSTELYSASVTRSSRASIGVNGSTLTHGIFLIITSRSGYYFRMLSILLRSARLYQLSVRTNRTR